MENVKQFDVTGLNFSFLGNAVFNQSNVVFGFSTTFNVKFAKSWTGKDI